MKALETGQFHGITNTTIQCEGITITDTEYTHDKVDWHYHENAYFTFILQGKVLEGNRKETYTCLPGNLLFHHWQDPHYNIKPPGYTRGFQIELSQQWIRDASINMNDLAGSMKLSDPAHGLLMYKIFRETKLGKDEMNLAVNTLLIELLTGIHTQQKTYSRKKPSWTVTLKEILHDDISVKYNLQTLSRLLNIHPVHLSRDFPKYFHCSLGDYIRKLKVQKALSMLSDQRHSLCSISLECGFADQSHFIRCFKLYNGIKPLEYRKLILQPS